MQTLSVTVQNDFIGEFMSYVEKCNDKIRVNKDLNLEYDPYFYKRRESLHKISDGIKSGKTKLQNWSEFELEMDTFENRIESKYAD